MKESRPCIIGAGPAGSSAALFLAKLGIPSLLTDRSTFPRDKICGDALSGKVVEVLNKLDPTLRQELDTAPFHVGSWGVRFVAPNGKDVRVPFKQQYNAVADMSPGYIAKRLDFDNWLFQKAAAHPLVEVRTGHALKTVQRTIEGMQLTFDNGNQLTTPLVLAADGAHSVVAKQLHGFTVEPSHYCAGIRAYYRGVEGLEKDNFIELHFVKDALPGYLWVFPLPDGRANVGVGMRSDFVSRRKVNLKTLLTTLLENSPELKPRFANAVLEGPVQGFGLPLGSKKRSISGDGYLLLGDAGSLIDPFTGEGIGNAMISGLLAAPVVQKALETGDVSAAALKAYDDAVYRRLWSELQLGKVMQELVRVPWLFNFVVNKAQRNRTLRETISSMFEDIELRQKLKQPSFYLKLLFD